MDVDRETVHQLILAGGAVAIFIATTVFVGTTYGSGDTIRTEGGPMLVATIGLFVVLMLGAGLWLERQDF